jgi:hypothetical protein
VAGDGESRATLTIIPAPLAEAMRTTLTLPVQAEGPVAAQRAIVTALQDALEAGRQRILIRQSEVTEVKWITLFIQAICTLTAIAMVHADNRPASAVALGLFSTAIAVPPVDHGARSSVHRAERRALDRAAGSATGRGGWKQRAVG